ncbi:MAG: FAD:protein FMN transferase [Devosiaceae bacterium]|nr:FAD:protein FMN transferase [Devosiaceae bacterium]
MKRRRVLSMLGGIAALPVIGAQAAPNVRSWRGIVLGAMGHIVLDHPDAEILIAGALSEISRLENIFSLYRPKSELSRLNSEGALATPSLEMVELLSICAAINLTTKGAFDPSVQALWDIYAQNYANKQAPTLAEIAKGRQLTGFRYVNFSPRHIGFEKSGMKLTLNGIAQGYIADRIATYFRNNGVTNVLVNTGEIAALGVREDGTGWPIAIRGSAAETFPLSNSAIATSAPLGTVFDGDGKVGHIIDPRTGYPGGNWKRVSVICKSAARADGFSTAFCLMKRDDIELAKTDATVILEKQKNQYMDL